MEGIYKRETWAAEFGSNSRGSQQILHGRLIESSPDDAGNFRIRRATQQTADKESQSHAIFIRPYMGKSYGAFTAAPGLHGAFEEKHGALDSPDGEYADFIARVLETAAHARLGHIPGHGEKLPLG
jgi:hypothetical protein